MNIITTTILNFFYISILGFIITCLIYHILIKGYLGKTIQTTLENNILSKGDKARSAGINGKIIIFILFYLIIEIYMRYNVINLDGVSDLLYNLNVEVTGKDLEAAGALFGELGDKFGNAAAFATGMKVAGSFLSKVNMSIIGKIGAATVAGAGSSFTFSMITYSARKLIGVIEATKAQAANEINLTVKNVTVTSTNPAIDPSNSLEQVGSMNLGNFTTTFTNNSITNTSITNTSIPNTNLFPQPGLSTSALDFYKPLLQFKESNLNNSKVLESIEKSTATAKSLSEIFSNAPANGSGVRDFEITQVSSSINSPLESADLLLLELKETITTILTYDFALHLIMLYLIYMLTFIFTMKIIGDNNLYATHLEGKVRSLPLGKQINFIILKLISSWRHTSNFWIYFILFFLFIFICASTFGIFTCLFVLNYK